MAEPIISGGVRVQAVLAGQSGLARDAIVNTFHFKKTGAGGLNDTDFAALNTMVTQFYTAPPASVDSVAHWIGRSVNRGTDACSVKVYDLGTTPPRVPVVFPMSFPSFAGSADDSLPREVALCLSFKAVTKPGPRGRGRVYIGPLRKVCCVDGTGFAPMPTNAIQETLTACALRLLDASAAAGLPWQVNSKMDTAQHMHTVTSWWIDNEFDTQRRRGLRPTNRVAGPV